MATLGGLLSIGRSSLLANQAVLGLVTNNTANADTAGYSRRDVRLQSLQAGSGVGIAAVLRRSSPFLAQQLLGTQGKLGAHEAKAEGLSALEQRFKDNEFGLGARLDELFAGLRTLATDPADNQLRNDVIARGQGLCDAFADLAQGFSQQRRSADAGIGIDVTQVNDLAAEIAHQNQLITGSAPDSEDRAGHLDRRDQLVQRLGGLVELSSFTDDDGAITLLIQGGNALVSGNESSHLVASADASLGGMRRIDLVDASGSALDVTQTLRGGSLGGQLELRDEILVEGADRIDRLAFDLANAFNGAHASGYGTDGVTGRDFFQAPAAVAGAATTLSLAAGLRDNPSWVAAASGAATAVGGSDNVLTMLGLADAALAGGNTVTFGEEIAGLTGDIGRVTRSEQQAADNGAVRLEQIQALYDSDTGVSIDEELIDMTKYQRAYQAGARILDTVDQLYQTLLNL